MNEELKIFITAEIEGLKKAVKEAQEKTKETSEKGKKNFEAFGKAAKACGKVIVEGMKIAVTAIAAGATALVGLAESTREYRTEQAKLKTAFETAGASAEQAKTTYNGLFRVLGDSGQATEAANHLAQLTTNEKELAEWTNICQGVYATFGDSLAIEGLTEAANETAKVAKVTGTFADAINWAKVSNEDFAKMLSSNKDAQRAYNKAIAEGEAREDAFSAALAACSTEAEREKLIRETLNTIYDDAAKNYEKNAEELLKANEAQAKLTDGLANLGKAVEPLITAFKSLAGDALAKIAPWIDTISRGLQDMVNGVDGGAYLVERGIGKLVQSAVSMLNQMLPTVLTIGTQLIVALIQGIVSGLPQLVNTISTAIPMIITALLEVIPQLIGAILGALPLVLETVIQAVAAILNGLAEMLPTIVDQLMAFLPVFIDTLIQNIPVLLQAAVTLLMAIVDAIPKIIPPLLKMLPKIVVATTELLLDYLPLLLDTGIQLFFAIIDAIPEIIPPLVSAMPTIITSIIAAIIKSIPQLLAAGIELFLALVASIPKIIPDLINALGQIVDTIARNLIDEVKGLMDFKWEFPKLKLPHFKVTGEFSLNPPRVPKLSIDWYAKGGVFDTPTLFNSASGIGGLGEAGAEAIVPLENNLGWLNKLATMLDDRMGGKGPIVLQVDGKTFAQTSISTINQLTRQTGQLGLTII